MSDGVAIPLHLAVHVLGVAVAAGLAALGWTQREEVGPTWPGLVVGGGLLAVSHLLTGGLLLDTATLAVVLRAAGYAGIAVGATGTFASSTAVLLVAPIGVHAAAGLAGVMAAAATAVGQLRARGPVLLLSVGLGGWAFADAFGRTFPSAAAAVSVLSSGCVAVWTVRRVGASLVARMLAGATALVVVTVLVLSGAGGLVFAQDLEDDQLTSLAALTEAQARTLATEAPAALRDLASALSGSALSRQVAEGGNGLDARARALAELPGVDVAIILGPQGTVEASWTVVAQVPGALAPVDETTLAGAPLVQQALGGVDAAGTLTTSDRQLLAVGVAPIAPRGEDGSPRLDRVNGVLVLGRSVSSAAALRQVAEQTAADAMLLVSGRLVRATDPDLEGPNVNQEVVQVLATSELPTTATIADGSRFVAVAQVGTVGRLLLLRDDAAGGDLERDATRTLFVAGVLGLVLAAGLAIAGTGRLVAPVVQLTDAAERLAAGEETEELPTASGGEVGRLAEAFGAMVGAVADREADLAAAADEQADLRRRIEIITSSLSEALVAVDEHGIVTRANPAAAKLLGVDRLEGQPVTKVLTGSDDAGRTVLAALANSEGRVVKATVGRDEVEVAATSAPLLDARGRTLGRVHLLRDVTGEAQAERMKTEFLANISHELRTPLTPVRGYADVLVRRELPHEQVADLAGRISSSAQRLERVIGMLVDYAALEAGRFDVTFEATPVRATIEAALADLREHDADDRLEITVDEGLPALEVDPNLFRRQVVELVDNALKFSEGTVTVSARRGPNRTLVVAITDRGDGIDPASLAEVRGGFRQGDGSATRRHGGLGLGLAMVHRIADALGGEVRVETPADGGTRILLVNRTVV